MGAPETPRTSRLYGTQRIKKRPPINRPPAKRHQPTTQPNSKIAVCLEFLARLPPLEEDLRGFFNRICFCKIFRRIFYYKTIFYTKTCLTARDFFSRNCARLLSTKFCKNFFYTKLFHKILRDFNAACLLSHRGRLIIEQQLKVNEAKPIGLDGLHVLGPGSAHDADDNVGGGALELHGNQGG